MKNIRIGLNDTIKDVAIKMSDGNPGALMAMMDLIKQCPTIDPEFALGGLGLICFLDEWGIYGTDIYVLHSDICERKTNHTIAVIRATQLGLFSHDKLISAAHKQDRSGRKDVPVEDLYNRVCEELPNFDPTRTQVPEGDKT